MIVISSEQIENLIAMVKKFSVCKNTGKIDCFIQIAKFADLYCVGTVMSDLIDFTKIINHLKRQKLLIYDPQETPQLFEHLEKIMPNIMLNMVNDIQNMNVGDPLPPMIGRIYDHCDVPQSEMLEAERDAAGFINDMFWMDHDS